VIPDKLYKAYSFVEDHHELGNVCLKWFYHLRDKRVPLPDQPEQLLLI